MTAAPALGREILAERPSLEEWAHRLIAVVVWRNPRKQAEKLADFAATEAGSSLDMLRAAERVEEPELSRLFFRHAMDEARHARLFRDAARRLGGRGRAAGSVEQSRGQDLFERFGLLRFVAFVYVAERRGEIQFRALAWHFRRHLDLGPLFARIAHDEAFHVAYSKKLLTAWGARDGGAVRAALLRVRCTGALEAWRRSGRGLGGGLGLLVLGLVYVSLLPLFAWLARMLEPARMGWRTAPHRHSLEKARGQY